MESRALTLDGLLICVVLILLETNSRQADFPPPFVPISKKQNEAFVFEFYEILLRCPVFWNDYFQLSIFIYSYY